MNSQTVVLMTARQAENLERLLAQAARQIRVAQRVMDQETALQHLQVAHVALERAAQLVSRLERSDV